MIAFLSGTLKRKSPPFIILDVQGVGYRVFIPQNMLVNLPDLGEALELEIHTVVKENEISLYGFCEAMACNVFGLLLSINGVGPKLALNILSHITWHELVLAVQEENVAQVKSIKGVGEKTAKLIVLGLKSKFKDLEPFMPPSKGGNAMGVSSSLTRDAQEALMNLGYSKTMVQRALGQVNLSDDKSLAALIKASLQVLAGVQAR